jgi:hypothetical protein
MKMSSHGATTTREAAKRRRPMNRHQRRRAKALKVGSVVGISLTRCTLAAPKPCFLCGEEAREWPWPDGRAANASGGAVVKRNDGRAVELMVLCEACWSSDECSDNIMRQAFGAGLEIAEGGYATPEEVAEIAGALAEKQSAVEH